MASAIPPTAPIYENKDLSPYDYKIKEDKIKC